MREQQVSNSINRVLKARGLPLLGEPGIVEALAFLVEDHQHLMELLRACDPKLRRDMYEAMRPHLRFKAKPLEDYVIAAKAHAEAAELPVLDEQGFLLPYRNVTIEVPEVQLLAECWKCGKQAIFLGAYRGDAIFNMRHSSWAFDESTLGHHLCPECLDGGSDALDAPSSETAAVGEVATDRPAEREDDHRAEK